MKNARMTTGNFGSSTSPIAFAPAIKSNKERLLKKFRQDLGRKGYLPAEATAMAAKVRAEANALAVEMNARQGNDDPVRMANIHTMALKMKIADALKAAPKKTMGDDGMMGRISRTSPMAVSVADRGRDVSADSVRKRGERRRAKAEAQVYDMYNYRKKYGHMKDEILNEAKRASYMQQFNGALGHYYGGQMGKWKKPKIVQKVQKGASKGFKAVAKPIAQAAKYTEKSVVRAANMVKKDPIGALAKVAIAPISLVASAAPAHTQLGRGARNLEKKGVGAIKQGVKFVGDVFGKFFKFICTEVISKVWELIKKYFKKLFDWFGKLVSRLKEAVYNKFHGSKGISGMGELGADEKADEMKHIEKSVLKTANKLKGEGQGAFLAGVKTFAMKDVVSGKGYEAGKASVKSKLGYESIKAGLEIAASGGTASGAAMVKTVAKSTAYFAAGAGPVTANEVAQQSPAIGEKVISDIKEKAFDEACKDYGKDLAGRKLKGSPLAQAVTQKAIDGELKGDMTTVNAVASGISDPAKRQEFINKAASLPTEKRVEMMKQVAIPSNFKPIVKDLDKQTEKIAAANVNKLTKNPIQSTAEFANNLGSKNVEKLPPQAVQAYVIQGEIVQDQVAAKLAAEGKISKTEAVAAMSPIGQKAVIQSVPAQQRAIVAKEIESEKPEVIKEAIQDKKKADMGKAFTAAAIAAKVLLF